MTTAAAMEPTPTPDAETRAEILAWLDAFASAVRNVDYTAGEKLFASDVVGFGTVGVLLSDLDQLKDRQWRRVWGVTSGFRFLPEPLSIECSDSLAWVAVTWHSLGRRDGEPFDRRGRATYVLERRQGRWLAVHSHHSLDPDGTPPGSSRS